MNGAMHNLFNDRHRLTGVEKDDENTLENECDTDEGRSEAKRQL